MSVREIMARIIRDETGEADEESGFVADAILAVFHVTLKQPVEQPGPRPMNARERVQAMIEGRPLNDGVGKSLTRNARGEYVNEIGDTPCPSCGEMTNRRCWRCGWVRPVPLRVIPFGDHPADGILIADDEQAARDRIFGGGD